MKAYNSNDQITSDDKTTKNVVFTEAEYQNIITNLRRIVEFMDSQHTFPNQFVPVALATEYLPAFRLLVQKL